MQFETPKSIKQEPASKGKTDLEEEIYVMPEKFRKNQPISRKTGKKKSTLILILIIAGILIIGGLIGFYFWTGQYQPQQPIVESPSKDKETPVDNSTIPAKITPFPEETLRAEVKNVTSTISHAQFHLPEGAVAYGTKIEMTGSQVPNETIYKNYKVISGLYKINPFDVTLRKPCNFKIFYNKKLINKKWEKDLVIGYFKDDIWTPLKSKIDIQNNLLEIDFKNVLPADTLAIIVDKEKMILSKTRFAITPQIPMSKDSDDDGLTDVEELIYHTLKNNPDSDVGGGTDGEEVIKLMDPNRPGEAKLATSGLIHVYTNPSFYYSIFYPKDWLVRAIPETNNKEILIITNTGDFFQVLVEDNQEKLSALNWYLLQSPEVDTSTLVQTKVKDMNALWNPDHSTIYITKGDKVYIFSYNIGTEEKANFKATFQMMINSFQFVVKTSIHPDGTLIQYPDNPAVYLIKDGKKCAFKSGEAFTSLGYKWSDVVKISLDETYIEGEPIPSHPDGTLIQYPDNPAVYLIKDGKKCAFKSGEAFTSLGYKWSDVVKVPSYETYPDGEPIE